MSEWGSVTGLVVNLVWGMAWIEIEGNQRVRLVSYASMARDVLSPGAGITSSAHWDDVKILEAERVQTGPSRGINASESQQLRVGTFPSRRDFIHHPLLHHPPTNTPPQYPLARRLRLVIV